MSTLHHATQHRRTRRPGEIDAGGTGTRVPRTIPDLALWLRADAITGCADGDPLAIWLDQSGNERNAEWGVNTQQPTYQTNEVNSLPCLNFDNSNDGLVTPWVVSSGELSMLVLLRTSLTSGTHRAVQGSNNWLIGSAINAYVYYNGTFRNDGAISAGTWKYLYITQAASGWTFYVNGSSVGSGAGGGYPGTIGLGVRGAFSDPFGGDIAEIIGYSRVLTTTERDAISQYIRDKYALP